MASVVRGWGESAGCGPQVQTRVNSSFSGPCCEEKEKKRTKGLETEAVFY